MISSSNSSRRTFLKTSATLSTVGLAGCLGNITGSGSDTVRIGSPIPNSGALALFGQINQQGYEFAREKLGGEILGNEFEIVVRDTKSEPSTGVRVTRELVEEEEVDALMGITSSAVGINTVQYIKDDGQVPLITSQFATNAAREVPKFCNQYTFFPWPSFRQMVLANDRFISEELPGHVDGDIDTSQMYIVAMDFEAGQSARDVITEMAEERGATIEGSTMVPLDVSDWSTYLPDPQNAESDIITGFIPGQQAVSFIKQASNFGLTEDKTLAFLGDTTSPIVLAPAGEAANGMFSTHWWDPNRDTELNNEYLQWHGENVEKLPPNEAHASAFNQLWSLAQAIEAAGSTNTDDVISELEGLEFESPMGQLSYRAEDHQTRLNFIGDVVEGGSLTTLIEYEDVIGPAKCNV